MTENEINAMLRPPPKPVTIEDSIVRDYFAGQVLAGLVTKWEFGETELTVFDLAEEAYRIADAMMDERKK